MAPEKTEWQGYIESARRKATVADTRPKQGGLRPSGSNRPIAVPRYFRQADLIPPDLLPPINAVISAESPWPLVLIGRPGTGKTCAALCMLDYAGGAYYSVSALCALLIQSQQGRLEWSHEGRGGTLWPEQFWSRLAKEPLVVLDELGCRSQVSDAHYEAVKTAVEERHNRPLIVISNLTLSEIEVSYDARIASRLAAGTVFETAGDDLRLQ